MKVFILVEGQTEETFVRDVLASHLEQKKIFVTAKVVITRPVLAGANYKGGINRYQPVKKDLQKLLGDSSAALVTTMIDFYGLLVDFPKPTDLPTPNTCFDRVKAFEAEFAKDIGHQKFLPYFMLHEFEAMLFVDPEQIADSIGMNDRKKDLLSIRKEFKSPEEINDDPKTAPSKRILNLMPSYRKPLFGSLITGKIGLERIRAECSHFNEWLQKLEALGEGNQ